MKLPRGWNVRFFQRGLTFEQVFPLEGTRAHWLAVGIWVLAVVWKSHPPTTMPQPGCMFPVSVEEHR